VCYAFYGAIILVVAKLFNVQYIPGKAIQVDVGECSFKVPMMSRNMRNIFDPVEILFGKVWHFFILITTSIKAELMLLSFWCQCSSAFSLKRGL